MRGRSNAPAHPPSVLVMTPRFLLVLLVLAVSLGLSSRPAQAHAALIGSVRRTGPSSRMRRSNSSSISANPSRR